MFRQNRPFFLFGKYTEEMFFEGDQSAWNPMRYIPTPFHTKFAQKRTALNQYIQQETIGTRMRRRERPIHDFLAPYLRGVIARVTGADDIPAEVECPAFFDPVKERHWNKEKAWDEKRSISQSRL